MTGTENDPAVKQENEEAKTPVADTPQSTTEENSGDDTSESEDAAELEIVVAGEQPVEKREKEPAPEWVKALRKDHRATKEENAELKRKLAAASQPAAVPDDPGPEPTFESCDHDAQVLKQRLRDYDAKKARHENAKAEAAKEVEARQQAWQATLRSYEQSKTELAVKVPKYIEYESAVNVALSHPQFGYTQQGILMSVAKNPALVIAALGQSPKLLDDLAKEHNFARFAAEVGRLEARITVKDRKPTNPPPDRPVRGGSGSGSVDAQLDKLEAEAARNGGDRSKIVAYKREQAQRKK